MSGLDQLDTNIVCLSNGLETIQVSSMAIAEVQL